MSSADSAIAILVAVAYITFCQFLPYFFLKSFSLDFIDNTISSFFFVCAGVIVSSSTSEKSGVDIGFIASSILLENEVSSRLNTLCVPAKLLLIFLWLSSPNLPVAANDFLFSALLSRYDLTADGLSSTSDIAVFSGVYCTFALKCSLSPIPGGNSLRTPSSPSMYFLSAFGLITLVVLCSLMMCCWVLTSAFFIILSRLETASFNFWPRSLSFNSSDSIATSCFSVSTFSNTLFTASIIDCEILSFVNILSYLLLFDSWG